MSNPSSNNEPKELMPVVYNPSEVIGLFSDALAKRSAGVIYVRGVYHPGRGISYSGYYYDTIKDEYSSKELTIIVSSEIRSQLTEGNLVDLKGLVDRKVSNDCSVKLQLQVTGLNIVQEQTLSEEDLRKVEIRNYKARAGFKNVDGILESAIYADRRPSVGLIYADSSITDADFNKGKEAAETQIDFREYRVTFSRPDAFVQILGAADKNGHDCICIVRGGGAGLEALENLSVLDCVSKMETAIVTAVGHTTDKVFINEIADLEIGTPSLLGSYFQNTVERVSKKKADSTAALSKKIEAQFKQQLETAKKQNEELQKKIGELTKANTDAQKLHDEQVKASQKQLDELAKGNGIARQKDREQMDALQKRLTELTQTNKNQSENFTRELGKMQDNLNRLTNENKSLVRSLSEAQNKKGSVGLIIIIVILVIMLLVSLLSH